MSLSSLPNLISLLRMLMVPPVAYLIHHQAFGAALALFVVAGLSDGIDGFLAKHFGWTSRLGTILDPMADKLLVVVTFLMLTLQGLLPWWLLALVATRDAGIVLLGVHYLLRPEPGFEIRPRWSSKVNTAAQLGLLTLVMLQQWMEGVPAGVVSAMVALVTVTTVWSGAVYVRMWVGRGRREGRARAAGPGAPDDGRAD